MPRTPSTTKSATMYGAVLIATGVAVFAIRLIHAGPYAIPIGTNLFAALGSLVLGSVILWADAPRLVRKGAFVLSPVALFFGLYSTFAEFEEVVSLYATDSAGRPAELRLWIVDREDGEWVGMSRAKAIEYSLNGRRIEMLRNGEKRCIVPVLHDDIETIRDIHSRKVGKYKVAQWAAMVGIYSREGNPAGAALHLTPCPAE